MYWVGEPLPAPHGVWGKTWLWGGNLIVPWLCFGWVWGVTPNSAVGGTLQCLGPSTKQALQHWDAYLSVPEVLYFF